MISIAQEYLAERSPKAPEYLVYGRSVFNRLPNSFRLSKDKEDTEVSCHHLCEIVKHQFSELIIHTGLFYGRSMWPTSPKEIKKRGLDLESRKVSHSWLWPEDHAFTLDMYPIWQLGWPILIDWFVQDPRAYGIPRKFKHLRTKRFQKEVNALLEILWEKRT